MRQCGCNLCFELHKTVEIAEQNREIAAEKSDREATCKTVHQGHNPCESQSKEGGNGQIKGGCRDDRREFDQCSGNDIAIVVVVNVAAREPGIIGRHVRTAHHGVKKRQFHRFFSTDEGVPQIGIEGANTHKKQEGQGKNALFQ